MRTTGNTEDRRAVAARLAPDPTPRAGTAGAADPYRPALDGLRALAILLVIAYHDRLLGGGFLGVQLFFVLSGYLITSILQREWEARGSVRLARFYGRRFLRLTPALVLFVLIAWAVTHWLKPGLATGLEGRWALAALGYVSNLLIAFGREYPLGVVSITWSLALEEQFYLLWPATLVVLRRARLSRRGLALVLAGLIGACIARRFALLAAHPEDPGLWLRVYFGPDTNAEALLWGCMLALLARPHESRRFERAAGWLALAGTCTLALLAALLETEDVVRRPLLLSLTAVSSCALILGALARGPLRRLLELPLLVWIGQLSYSLYLWHAFSIELLVHEPRWRRHALMLALAVASHHLVERPVQGLARRFGALPRPPPWALRSPAERDRIGLACGLGGLALALALGTARLTGTSLPGLALSPLVQARERSVDREHERALEQYRLAAERAPDDARVSAERTEALVRAGAFALEHERPQDAVAWLSEAAAARPDDGELRNHLGVALVRAGQLAQAIEQFRESVRLGTGATAEANLARALRKAARDEAR